MRRLLSISVVVLLTSYVCAGNALYDDVVYNPVDTRLLPSNHVKCLYQDSEGFIWIGTNNGLARYDGSSVVSYTGHLENYSFLYEVVEGYDGSLLLATDKGLVILDKVSGRSEVLIEGLAVSSLAKDTDGNIWAGGEDGLFFCPADDSSFEKVDVLISGAPLEGVIDLLPDSEGKVWMTTWQKGLYLYDPVTCSTSVFKKDDLAYSYVLHQDSDDRIWVGTWGRGLLELSEDFESTSDYILYNPIAPDGTNQVDEVIYAINDVSGHILVGGQKGFSIIDPVTHEMTFYAPGTAAGSLPYNQVNSILVTLNGNVFLGLYGGGMCSVDVNEIPYSTDPLSDIRQRFGTNTVHSIFSDVGSWLWMGIPDNGFVLYEPQSHKVFRHDEIPAFKGMLSISTAFAIRKRSCTGEICIGTYSEGLWIYDTSTGKVKVYASHTCPDMDNSNILTLENDSAGNIWIGTHSGAYVLTPDDRMMSLEDFAMNGDASVNTKVQIPAVAATEDGKVFLATASDGIISVDVVDRTYALIPGSLSPVSYTTITSDVNGDIWVGSLNDGLYFYDVRNDRFQARMPVEGLVSDCITNIVQLPDGEIWVTTSSELLSFYPEYDTDSLRVTRYISDLGVDFCANSSKILDNAILFGTTDGIFRYDLDDNTAEPCHGHMPVIADFIVNGRSYRELDMLDADINYVDEVKVKKGDNVEVRYTLLDYNHFFSPIYRISVDDIVRNTVENSISLKVDGRRTELEICYLPSGNCRKLVLKTSGTAYLLNIALLIICLAAGLYLVSRKRKLQHDVIAFEVDKINFTSPDQELLQKAMDVIQKHISDADFKQEDFIREMGISRTLLTEKLKEITGFTPSSLIMEVRLKTAYNSIMSASGKLRISDVAYSIGFNDAKYFGTCFRKKYGLTPKELMSKRLEELKNNVHP